MEKVREGFAFSFMEIISILKFRLTNVTHHNVDIIDMNLGHKVPVFFHDLFECWLTVPTFKIIMIILTLSHFPEKRTT